MEFSSVIHVLHSKRGTFPTLTFYTFVQKDEKRQQWHRVVPGPEQTHTLKKRKEKKNYTNRTLRLFSRMTSWLRVPSLNICTSERCRVCDPDAELLLLQALAGGWKAGFLNGHRQGHLRSSSDHCGRNKKQTCWCKATLIFADYVLPVRIVF